MGGRGGTTAGFGFISGFWVLISFGSDCALDSVAGGDRATNTIIGTAIRRATTQISRYGVLHHEDFFDPLLDEPILFYTLVKKEKE